LRNLKPSKINERQSSDVALDEEKYIGERKRQGPRTVTPARPPVLTKKKKNPKVKGITTHSKLASVTGGVPFCFHPTFDHVTSWKKTVSKVEKRHARLGPEIVAQKTEHKNIACQAVRCGLLVSGGREKNRLKNAGD